MKVFPRPSENTVNVGNPGDSASPIDTRSITMCGIWGFFGTYARQVNIDLMNSLLKHRGPDDCGSYVSEQLVMGHTRLSIIDVSGGHQPISDPSSGLVLVFNGEIYNFRELRKELDDRGFIFSTRGDSEVVLNGYKAWGSSVVEKLEGMFAFAIYDERAHTLFLARDRMGVKPLYYARWGGMFGFASEIKALLGMPGARSSPNKRAIESYLRFRHVLGNETFYEGIYSLDPGHYMVLTESGCSIERYWVRPRPGHRELPEEPVEDIVAEVRRLVTRSVIRHMMSDVPYGCYLSGGLDSSIVASVMAQNSDQPVQTFTIGFEERGFNEFEPAKIVAKHLGTDHHEILLSRERYLEEWENLIWYKDQPLAVPNEVALAVLSQELKQYITVVLSGEGSDELFAGYGRIMRSPFDLEQLMRGVGSDELRQKYGSQTFQSEVDHFIHLYDYFGAVHLAKLFRPEHKDLYPLDGFRGVFDRAFSPSYSYEDNILYFFQEHHLPGLLGRLDTATMRASVEGRVPFVDDHLLVEYVNRIPFGLKNKLLRDPGELKGLTGDSISEVWDVPKYVLKKAFEDIVPACIVTRRKMGFPVPLDDWFSGGLMTYAHSVLIKNPPPVLDEILDRDELERWLRNSSGTKGQGQKVWMLVNLSIWCQRF